MRIGVPREVKNQEYRVGLTPAAVAALTARSHTVLVETEAGVGAGFGDGDYAVAGGTIVPTAADAFSADLVVKVKEPLSQEYGWLRPDLILFTYLHLAADRPLTEALIHSKTLAIAYETVQLPNRTLPLLHPMSAIAGRLSVQFGAHYLTKQQGGSGVLLGGIPGVRQGRVVILGGGVVGVEAAKMAVGLGARVQILDVNMARLSELEELFGSRVEFLFSSSVVIAQVVPEADLLVGAVLIPGSRAPKLVAAEVVAAMRPGSVVVDVAVDQGGCVATTQVTSHTQPIHTFGGVLHYGVPNMPGAVPQTATQGLVNVTLPHVLAIADLGVGALERDPALALGVNVRSGQICHPAVAQAFPDLPHAS
ncbi:MAG: alanine dehydrogenase [Oscillatoriales cyanobacterium SM2_2_1]|nr:alanine dehydrogenase [Oscillatoriales cyanobacterium SM2_2_1]